MGKKRQNSPIGCLSDAEIIAAINKKTELTILNGEFTHWVKTGLFPEPDMRDKNTGIFYWSDFIVERWLKAIPVKEIATSRQATA